MMNQKEEANYKFEHMKIYLNQRNKKLPENSMIEKETLTYLQDNFGSENTEQFKSTIYDGHIFIKNWAKHILKILNSLSDEDYISTNKLNADENQITLNEMTHYFSNI
jgi:hypothetical protein